MKDSDGRGGAGGEPLRAEGGTGLELVTIGDELLLGETVDSNSAWLGRRLAAAGIRVLRRTTVGDDEAAIRDAVRQALERAGTVLCTGGLGPTRDDVTREAVASLLDRPLRVEPAVLEAIRGRFADRGLEMPEVNRRQAEVPEGARVFPNSRGTAPGLALEDARGRLVVLLPGVPFELHALVEEHVLAFLLERMPSRTRPIRHRVLHTTGLPESELAHRIDDLLDGFRPLSVAFLPSPIGVDLRLTSRGAYDEAAVEAAFDAAEAAIRSRIDRYVYARDDDDLPAALARLLERRGWTLAVAESCTGGLLAKRLTDRPGASRFFFGGVVAYADPVKTELLGVPQELIRENGAVSGPVARAMADGARRRTGADAAIAITGIAGPAGGTPDKPVGTVWVGVAAADGSEVRHFRFGGDRDEVRERAAQAALALLWTRLRAAESGQAPGAAWS